MPPPSCHPPSPHRVRLTVERGFGVSIPVMPTVARIWGLSGTRTSRRSRPARQLVNVRDQRNAKRNIGNINDRIKFSSQPNPSNPEPRQPFQLSRRGIHVVKLGKRRDDPENLKVRDTPRYLTESDKYDERCAGWRGPRGMKDR